MEIIGVKKLLRGSGDHNGDMNGGVKVESKFSVYYISLNPFYTIGY